MPYCHNENCNTQPMLILDDVDQRQEWAETWYHCPDCGMGYTLRTEYKCQSSLIASEELIDENGKVVE